MFVCVVILIRLGLMLKPDIIWYPQSTDTAKDHASIIQQN